MRAIRSSSYHASGPCGPLREEEEEEEEAGVALEGAAVPARLDATAAPPDADADADALPSASLIALLEAAGARGSEEDTEDDDA